MKARDVMDKKNAIKITLSDGIEREIKFTLNALAELEDRYGTVAAAFDRLNENSIKAVRCILWAGFMHDKQNPISEEDVGNLIDLAYMQELMNSLGSALEQNMPANSTESDSSEGEFPNE